MSDETPMHPPRLQGDPSAYDDRHQSATGNWSGHNKIPTVSAFLKSQKVGT